MLPNLIVIGAAKCGTTSMHRYLGQHPDVWMAAPEGTHLKSMRFFWSEDWRERREWYEAHFESSCPVRGEATPAYTAYAFHPGVPERMHELIPEAKLIYLVRDPIERILSHWVQRRSDLDSTPFERYMEEYERPDNPIVCPSRYWTQIQQYLPFYDPAQLLIVDQHDLKTRRRETMREVFRFIGVDESFDSPEFDVERNTRADKHGLRTGAMRLWEPVLWPASRAVPRRVRDVVRAPANKLLYGPVRERPQLTPEMSARLREHLAPEVEALREFTGKPFASWSL
jgi:hypothetical protein